MELEDFTSTGLDVLTEGRKRALLRGRVVKAADAYSCCSTNSKKDLLKIQDFLNLLLQMSDSTDPNLRLAYIPGSVAAGVATSGQFKLIEVVEGGPLVLGAVVLIGVEKLLEIAAQTALLEVIGLIGQAIGTILDDTTFDDCFLCVVSTVLSQDKPRKRVEAVINKRI